MFFLQRVIEFTNIHFLCASHALNQRSLTKRTTILFFALTLLTSNPWNSPAFAHGAHHNLGERIKLSPLSRFKVGPFDTGSAESAAFDPISKIAFVTNAYSKSVDAISLIDPEIPSLEFSIDLSDHGRVNSVAIKNNHLAIAVESKNPQDVGAILLFDTQGNRVTSFEAQFMPDMVTFSHDEKLILCANEGEANSQRDPEGSITVVELNWQSIENSQVTHIGFNQYKRNNIDPLIKISPGANTVAQDFEPEYIAISQDSKTAWVSLQENNAIAEINLEEKQVKHIHALGFKDHSMPFNALDASDKDNKIEVRTWPVKGMYQPDSIANYDVDGKAYIVTANEGDSRDSEVTRAAKLSTRVNAQNTPNRLKVLSRQFNNNSEASELISFGGRSFSIWDESGNQVFDSGADFETITARDYPALFNQSDKRSDDRGPEPEALTIGKIGQSTYAFIGLERTGGIMIYNISKPSSAFFVDYYNNRSPKLAENDFNAGDIAPESLVFVNSKNSPNGKPFLISANEVSGTLSLYKIEKAPHKDR